MRQQIVYLGILSGLVVGYQNFKYIPQINMIKSEVQQSHAKELLGKNYAKSFAAKSQKLTNFESSLFNTVYSKLSVKHRGLAHRITDAVIKESNRNGIDPVFVLAIINTESSFNPVAVGSVGEMGLMQIRPETASWIASKKGIRFTKAQDLFKPEKNIEIGVAYIAFLRKKFNNQASLYPSAYNMGAGTVRRLIASDTLPKIYKTKVMKNYSMLYQDIIKQNQQGTVAPLKTVRLASHESFL